MDYIKVTILTNHMGIEPVGGCLYNMGVSCWEVEDFEEFESFLEETKDTWNYIDDNLVEKMKGDTRVNVYMSDNSVGMEQLNMIRGGIENLKRYDKEGLYGKLDIVIDNVKAEDWENNWKKYFKPMQVGEKIVIRPEWEEYESTDGKTVFTINPGQLFGTGLHETTQLCIKEIEKEASRKRMLDLGCGSGILSIIALMLGVEEATAIDVDKNAINVAYENAALNGIGKDRYTVLVGDASSDESVRASIEGKYDLVVANIVADIVIAMLPVVKEKMTDDGVFISSGIITDREGDIEEAFKEYGFKIISKEYDKDWVAVKAVKE